MKKSKFIHGFIAMMALMLAFATSGTSVKAATTYTAVTGGTTTFNKYFVLDSNADVPGITFTYSITAGTAQDATYYTSSDTIPSGKSVGDIKTVAVYAGVTASSAPTVGTAVFVSTDTKTSTVASGDTVTLDTGESYVKKTVTVDFSGVSYSEPGIYRYVLTENEVSGRTDISYDTQKSGSATAKTRYLDVYITDTGSGTLQVSSYVLHETNSTVDPATNWGSGDVASTGTAVSDKSDGFVNEYLSQDLYVGKVVTGNQGSRDKYFDFTITLSGLAATSTYTVDITNADATSGTNNATISANQSKTNATSITSDANGAATVHYYLQNGQYVIVRGLPKNATYAVTENNEDYKSIPANTTSFTISSNTFDDAASGTVLTTVTEGDVLTGFTNTRDGIIPTEAIVRVLPGFIVVLLGIAGVVFIGKRKA